MLFLLRWLSRRSLRSLHAIGGFLGWVVYALSPSYRKRLRANAALAGVTPAQRRQSVAEAGKMVLESLRLWLRPRDQPIADAVHWQGEQIIEDGLEQGQGLLFVIVMTGDVQNMVAGASQAVKTEEIVSVGSNQLGYF